LRWRKNRSWQCAGAGATWKENSQEWLFYKNLASFAAYGRKINMFTWFPGLENYQTPFPALAPSLEI